MGAGGGVTCIDELYSPQLNRYGSRSQLSLTSCPAAADSCFQWLSSDKLIACAPARHQTAAWKSNLITRQENQHFRILHSPRSLFTTTLILMHSIFVHFNRLWVRLMKDCYVSDCSLTFKIATCKILKVKTVKIITTIVNRMWSDISFDMSKTSINCIGVIDTDIACRPVPLNQFGSSSQPPVMSSPAGICK